MEEKLVSWERQPNETNPAWAAFQIYRNLLPADRTLLQAYRTAKGQEKGGVCGTWRRWFEQNNWRDRAEGYDRHVDEKMRLELEGQRIEAQKETADLGRMLRQKAYNSLRVLTPISQSIGEKDGMEVWIMEAKLTPSDIARLASVGVDLERLALGQPQKTADITSDGARVLFFIPENARDDRDSDE